MRLRLSDFAPFTYLCIDEVEALFGSLSARPKISAVPPPLKIV